MALSITNNIASLVAQNNLGKSSSALNTSLQRLSSGLKINTGADSPAGLVISNEQGAQIAGLQSAIDNTNQAVSLVQTGEGALGEVNDLLVQIRGLTLSAANSAVNDSTSLAADQAQIANALQTIDNIAANTQFGTKKLLDGSAGINATSTSTALSGLNATSATTTGTYAVAVTQNAQKGTVDIGAAATTNLNNGVNLAQNETLTFNGSVAVQLTAGQTNTQVVSTINQYTAQTGVVASLDSTGNLVLTAQQFGGNFTVQSNVTAATAGSTGIGTTLVNTNTAGGVVSFKGQNATGTVTPSGGSAQNFTSTGNVVNLTTGAAAGLSFTLNASASNASVTDANANGATITAADGSLVFQIGANAGQTAKFAISNAHTSALGTTASTVFGNLGQINVTTASNAQSALAVIDQAINQVSTLRGNLGSFQTNTLQATATNLQTTLTNTTAAQSVIRDTDFAAETANFTKDQVLVQAGTTVLTNANATAQLILNLLK
jgi:flagellin